MVYRAHVSKGSKSVSSLEEKKRWWLDSSVWYGTNFATYLSAIEPFNLNKICFFLGGAVDETP